MTLLAVTHNLFDILFYYDIDTCQLPLVHNFEAFVGQYGNSQCRVDASAYPFEKVDHR